MPALPSVPKGLKVVVHFDDHVNLNIISRMFMQYTGSAPDNAALDTFCHSLYDDWVTSMIGLSGATIDFNGITALDLSSSIGAEGSFFDGNPGTRAGHPLPIDSAFVTSYEIARRYRGGHPRGYWPFMVSEDLENAQKFANASAAEVGTSFTAWRDAARGHVWSGGGTLGFVNISYYSGWTIVNRGTPPRAFNVPTVRGTPLVDAVTTFIPRTRVGTQRRRAQYG